MCRVWGLGLKCLEFRDWEFRVRQLEVDGLGFWFRVQGLVSQENLAAGWFKVRGLWAREIGRAFAYRAVNTQMFKCLVGQC